jgi:hypothetical protein
MPLLAHWAILKARRGRAANGTENEFSHAAFIFSAAQAQALVILG